ncbi:RNA-processing protein [Candidatus Woesearchaeota archaeon]|nr:RNA-processing protein [Candidatus Woesearchaeota archaeon]
MKEFQYGIKIPKERVAVLIGKNGKTKKDIEKDTKTNLEIDSKEGDVVIKGEDGLGIYTAKEVVAAIGRGFNPEIALLLLKVDYSFESINLKDYVGKSKSSQTRLKGRIIGKEGKARTHLEELTGCYISVYGKTVSIIGTVDSVLTGHRAIGMLIEGSTHATVYKWLEKKRREMKRKELR